MTSKNKIEQQIKELKTQLYRKEVPKHLNKLRKNLTKLNDTKKYKVRAVIDTEVISFSEEEAIMAFRHEIMDGRMPYLKDSNVTADEMKANDLRATLLSGPVRSTAYDIDEALFNLEKLEYNVINRTYDSFDGDPLQLEDLVLDAQKLLREVGK